MKLKQQQFISHLKKDALAPVYFITGDEPLLVQECTDLLRHHARQQGFSEREVLNVEAQFDWSELQQTAGNLSLFAQQRLIELRLGNKEFGTKGSQALLHYLQQAPTDILLLINAGRQTAAAQKSKWFQALDKAGIIVQIYTIEATQLPAWIASRLREQKVQASQDAIALIAERAEGHLLAAAQEIEKLKLLYPDTTLDVEHVLEAVTDSARFEVFGWLDTVLSGDAKRLVRQLNRLRAEGVEVILIASLLAREIHTLYHLAHAKQQGQSIDKLFFQYKVWKNRQAMVKKALQRHSLATLVHMLRDAVELEKMVKGAAAGDAWQSSLQLGLKIAGVNLLKGA